MPTTLIYIHDPMCSWCWAFKPALTQLISELGDTVARRNILGGLAPDSDQPMPQQMQDALQTTWQRIQQAVPGTRFNFDFWSENTPRRSTYPACRAVLAARAQEPRFEEMMISAIQEAYYLYAQNPSDHEVLVSLAADIGCQADRFSEDLRSAPINQALHDDLLFAQQLGVRGFPSLVLQTDDHYVSIPVDHNNASAMTSTIHSVLSQSTRNNP